MKLENICEDIVERVILDSDYEEKSILNMLEVVRGLNLEKFPFKTNRIKTPLWESKNTGSKLKQITLVI